MAHDPREAKLPKWAQAELARLRSTLEQVKDDFAEFADTETPDDADALANPHDKHPRLAARRGETVRFMLRHGPIDLKVDHYDSSLDVLAADGRPVAILPKTGNHLVITLPDY